MKLVVDSNILFSFFNEDSFTKSLIKNSRFKLYSPMLALEEINKHKVTILQKSHISQKEFSRLKKELLTHITFLGEEKYSSQFRQASELCPDENDIDFFALSLKINAPFWSNDKILKKQKDILVFSTTDIVKEFF